MGFYGGFDLMFQLFPFIFLVVFGFIIFTAIKNVAQYRKDSNSPISTVEAVVSGKRTKTDSHPHTSGDDIHQTTHHHTSTTYFATFELPNGERLEFRVSGKDYGQLRENDKGILTYQGSRFKYFERKG